MGAAYSRPAPLRRSTPARNRWSRRSCVPTEAADGDTGKTRRRRRIRCGRPRAVRTRAVHDWDRQMAFAKKFTVYTEFTKVTGLQPGAVVRILGAKAGSISQILPPNRPSEKFRVRLEIAESLHQLVR